jgi:hypothetical protein
MVPTNRALQTIETRLGVGLPRLLARFFGGDVWIRDINVVVFECLKGAGYAGKDGTGSMFEYDQIGEDIVANFSAYSEAVGQLLGAVFGPSVPKAEPPPSAAVPVPDSPGPSSSASP